MDGWMEVQQEKGDAVARLEVRSVQRHLLQVHLLGHRCALGSAGGSHLLFKPCSWRPGVL